MAFFQKNFNFFTGGRIQAGGCETKSDSQPHNCHEIHHIRRALPFQLYPNIVTSLLVLYAMGLPVLLISKFMKMPKIFIRHIRFSIIRREEIDIYPRIRIITDLTSIKLACQCRIRCELKRLMGKRNTKIINIKIYCQNAIRAQIY